MWVVVVKVRTIGILVVFVCLILAQQHPVGQGLLIHEVSRSHNEEPQSVGFLWTSDQLVAKTCSWQHTQNSRQTSLPPVGFEPTIWAGKRPQTYAFDRAATGTGKVQTYNIKYKAALFITKSHYNSTHLNLTKVFKIHFKNYSDFIILYCIFFILCFNIVKNSGSKQEAP